VFDFGCGCGRLTRFLQLSDRYTAVAADANPHHVAWCSKNLPNVRTFRPPIKLASNSIDFCYSLSVFTHLSSELATAWLEELARIIAPNGILAITTHGYPALEIISSSEQHQKMFDLTAERAIQLKVSLSELGHIYLPYSPEVLRAANVGGDYGNAFIEVKKAPIWPRALDLIEHIPGGLRGWQDIVVFRKR
jgi:SAM-dependent methyltransferase